MVKLVSVGRAKKHLKLKTLVSNFVPWDLEATRDETSRQPAWTLRQLAMIARFLSLQGAIIREWESEAFILGNGWETGLHKLWYPSIWDTSTWSKFGAHGEHGDVFLFSNLGAL